MQNKHSLNHQIQCGKKRKKKKKSPHDSSQEYNYEIDSQSQNIKMTEPPNYESNNIKKKKKKKKKLVNKGNSNESSEQIENAEDSNAEPQIVTNNFSENSIKEIYTYRNGMDSDCMKLKKKRKKLKNKNSNESSEKMEDAETPVISNSFENSIKEIDAYSNEMDFDSLKLKKKRKRLKNKNNSITEGNVSVSSDAEDISDAAFSDILIKNNLSENELDNNILKIKRKKFKNNDKSKSSNFPDVADTVSDTVFNDFSIRENNLSSNNSDYMKKIKKKLKNSEKSVECDEFSDEAEPTTSEVSRDLSLKKNKLLQSKAYQKLQAAKFRYLNEMLYTNSGKDALSYFQENTDEYLDYHLGYQSQVSKWPINPVDIIIQEISRM